MKLTVKQVQYATAAVNWVGLIAIVAGASILGGLGAGLLAFGAVVMYLSK